MGEINVVPYIDVMLVLLVIFMVTAPLLTQGIEVDLPKAASAPLDQPDELEPLIVSVDADGRLYLNAGDDQDLPVEAEVLRDRVAIVLGRVPETPVLIKADQSVAYGAVVAAMVLLQDAGAARVGFLTDPPPPTGRR
ncbi:MAG: protein TolR [Chromatiales bacterium]|nr:protein TolR [Chromatiales bacterium]